MVDLALLQSVSYIAGALGVCVAAVYYIFNMQVTQRNSKTALETRQAQFMSQIAEDLTSLESTRNAIDTMLIEWTDWEDFDRRWDSTVNPESASKRVSIMNKIENVGWLLEKGLLDPNWCYSQLHVTVTPLWLKYEPYVMQMRKKFNSPTIFIGFEHLGRTFADIERRKGIMAKVVLTKDGMKTGDID
jgi:hypothetical protein